MSIYKLCNALHLLGREKQKLNDQLKYYEEQNLAEKGRNSTIDFDKAIGELKFTLFEIEDEIALIRKLTKEIQ